MVDDARRLLARANADTWGAGKDDPPSFMAKLEARAGIAKLVAAGYLTGEAVRKLQELLPGGGG